MIHVVLADRHQLFHPGIQAILSQSSKLTFVGSATSSSQLQKLCRQYLPEVALLALNVTGQPQTEVIHQLQQLCPTTAVLVLVDNADDICLRHLQSCGVAGAIIKSEPPEKLVEAIMTIANGESWFSSSLVSKLIQLEVGGKSSELTEQEAIVLRLLAAEKTGREISQALNIAERTVRSRLTSIYKKLGVKSKSGAIREGVRLKLIAEG